MKALKRCHSTIPVDQANLKIALSLFGRIVQDVSNGEVSETSLITALLKASADAFLPAALSRW